MKIVFAPQVVLWLLFAFSVPCQAAKEEKSLADMVRIDMAKSRVESLMKRAAAPRSVLLKRPADGWQAKGGANVTLCTYAKNAEDRLNVYVETAEVYTIKETAAGKEELYLFYDGDDRLQFMLVLEIKK